MGIPDARVSLVLAQWPETAARAPAALPFPKCSPEMGASRNICPRSLSPPPTLAVTPCLRSRIQNPAGTLGWGPASRHREIWGMGGAGREAGVRAWSPAFPARRGDGLGAWRAPSGWRSSGRDYSGSWRVGLCYGGRRGRSAAGRGGGSWPRPPGWRPLIFLLETSSFSPRVGGRERESASAWWRNSLNQDSLNFILFKS